MTHLFKTTYCILTLFFLGAFFVFPACDEKADYEIRKQDPPDLNRVVVDLEITHQTIAGFGGANRVFGGTFPTSEDMQKVFGMGDDELGLSIFRIRVPPNQSAWQGQVAVALEAQQHGAKIIAAPWSPPAELKSNGSTVGGYLPEENYGAFVNHLNSYIDFMSDNGVEIYAISIQNEPDIEVSYESCDWTASAMQDFLANYGHLVEGAKLAAPESFQFNPSFTNAMLSNEAAAANLDLVAGHIYGGGLGPFPLAEEQGKEIWMTEYLLNLNATDTWSDISEEVIWKETLAMLETIHEAMEYNWNAYVWWYLKRYYSFIGEGAQGTTAGEILKRGYAFSQFSKFIRPGYVRVDVEDDSDSGLSITAYDGDGHVVVVLLNSGKTPVSNFMLSVAGMEISSAVSYTTALNMNRQKKELDPEEGSVVLSMLPGAVTTVVIEK